jgi:hypothetical protein
LSILHPKRLQLTTLPLRLTSFESSHNLFDNSNIE